MAILAAQAIKVIGTTPTFVAAGAGGDSAYPLPNQFLRVKNASGSPINVTLAVPGTEYGQARPSVVVAVPATTGDVSIDLPAELIDVNGLIQVTYSAVTSVTVALLFL
jgi:hypothetical protein